MAAAPAGSTPSTAVLVVRPLGQVGGDPRDAAAATHRDHHQVRLVLELAKHFDGYRALAGDGAQVVKRRYQRGPGAFHVLKGRRRSQIIGRPTHDQVDELPAVVADPVTLLLGGFGRYVDPAVHTQTATRIREALRVVARRRTHHARGQFLIGQLHQQVVRSA